MKTPIAFTLCATLALAVTACSHKPAACRGRQDYSEMKSLKLGNAQSDARIAYSKRDFRFIAVKGFTLQIPGVENAIGLKREYGLKIIPGTGDALCSKEQGILIENTKKYAEAYNREMLHMLRNNADFSK